MTTNLKFKTHAFTVWINDQIPLIEVQSFFLSYVPSFSKGIIELSLRKQKHNEKVELVKQNDCFYFYKIRNKTLVVCKAAVERYTLPDLFFLSFLII